MSEQIFISYRRDGGDVTAKLICEALKNRGYTVFYDCDSTQNSYFDARIMTAIEECDDFILVLTPNSLEDCVKGDDRLRLEIRYALKCKKNIIPVLLPGFSFPQSLPDDIAEVPRFTGIDSVVRSFELAVASTITDRLTSSGATVQQTNRSEPFQGLSFNELNDNTYEVSAGKCTDENITIPPSINGKPVTSIAAYAFHKKSSIKSITIPDSVTRIGESAFENCSALYSITIPDSVIKIERNAFENCIALKSITIPDSVKSIGASAFHGCKKLASINIPNGVTCICSYAFMHCISLTSVTISNSVTSIGAYAFADCRSLDSITIPDRIASIGKSAFADCHSLISITLPNSVTSIGVQAFTNCLSLTSFTLPDSVTNIGAYAFANCLSLTSITLPGNTPPVSGVIFNNCPQLTDIFFAGRKRKWRKSKNLGYWDIKHPITVHCTKGKRTIK